MLLLDITVPVYNAEDALSAAITELVRFLRDGSSWRYEVVIVNNGSTDRTLQVSRNLERQYDAVHVMHLDEKGRGRAIRASWEQSSADILCYMDVDLSTDLGALPALIEPLACGQCDIATGSRLLKPRLTTRCFKREVISRLYNVLVKSILQTGFSDAQCGFKAITKSAALKLLPLVEDNDWFFDTELLVLAEKLGYRIFDLPVRWTQGPSSTVRIWRTAFDDIKGLIRLKRRLQQ